jgi:hypothetical protein
MKMLLTYGVLNDVSGCVSDVSARNMVPRYIPP